MAHPQRFVKEIAVTPQGLRFLDILFVRPMVLKLVIATRPERRNKK